MSYNTKHSWTPTCTSIPHSRTLTHTHKHTRSSEIVSVTNLSKSKMQHESLTFYLQTLTLVPEVCRLITSHAVASLYFLKHVQTVFYIPWTWSTQAIRPGKSDYSFITSSKNSMDEGGHFHYSLGSGYQPPIMCTKCTGVSNNKECMQTVYGHPWIFSD